MTHLIKNLFDETTNTFTIIIQNVTHNHAFNKNLFDETINVFTNYYPKFYTPSVIYTVIHFNKNL